MHGRLFSQASPGMGVSMSKIRKLLVANTSAAGRLIADVTTTLARMDDGRQRARSRYIAQDRAAPINATTSRRSSDAIGWR